MNDLREKSTGSLRRAVLVFAAALLGGMVHDAWMAVASAGPLPQVGRSESREADIVLPGFDHAQRIRYEIRGETAVMEGDIIIGNVDADGNIVRSDQHGGEQAPGSVMKDGIWKWKQGIVPYVINASVPAAGQAQIQGAIAHWMSKLPVRFVRRQSTDKDYIEFVRGTSSEACSSWVGRKGGRQELDLSADGTCGAGEGAVGVLIHEIGHAMGLYHEQAREDRDNYVTIMWANVRPEFAGNFRKADTGSASDIGAYDFESVMHYGPNSFCKQDAAGYCVGPTIVTKPAGKPIGQRKGLSPGDVLNVLGVYNAAWYCTDTTNACDPVRSTCNCMDFSINVSHRRVVGDVNGDGRGDIVAFGNDGVYVSLATLVGGRWVFGPSVRWTGGFGHSSRWREGRHLRLLGDVNADGRDDVVGFGDAGVYVALSTGAKFTEVTKWVANFGFDSTEGGGWRAEMHPRFLADVNGDRRADIVGFGTNGVFVSLSTGSGFLDPVSWIQNYAYGPPWGWRVDANPRVMADVNGDGLRDIVGFASKAVYVSLSTGQSFKPAALWIANYTVGQGWDSSKHPRVLADVNGDGKSDIVGFGGSATFVSLSTGTGFKAPERWSGSFGYDAVAGGWRVDRHPRMLADVNGDGRKDIVGFAGAGSAVAISTGAGFSSPVLWSTQFGESAGAGGWLVDRHPRYVVDVDGDRKADIVGFGTDGVMVGSSTGAAFSSANQWTADYGYNDGWR